MQSVETKQIRLDDLGQVLFQIDPTNPLPGQPVARLKKGAALLDPDIEVVIDGIGDEGAQKMRAWLKQHIFTVLEGLMPLSADTVSEGPARDIARKIHDGLGVLPRANIEEDLARLDDAAKETMRSFKLRMGPMLVFIPALNRPAAIRLRALLWSLWHDLPLPAPVPHDGATSLAVADTAADPLYYRSIGYPLYGGRAIRVDMLDRLICAIYDGAKNSRFKAEHKMAEWLGCKIPDLYTVIEAMGHKKIRDPADEIKPEEQKEKDPATGQKPAEEKQETETQSGEAVKPEAQEAGIPEQKEQKRPELATFALKRGRAYESAPAKRGKKEPPKPVLLTEEEKAEREKARQERAQRKDRKDGGDRPRGGPRKERKFDKGRDDRPDRVISARAQAGESPFAILQSLKAKAGDGKN
ncbi:MAG: hypothetical protein HY370_07985 [Proteobacteria bacterium]|nr:hypothetical protein [Pseudomonadota bacterium]